MKSVSKTKTLGIKYKMYTFQYDQLKEVDLPHT